MSEQLLPLLAFAGGVVLLLKCGDLLVAGASSLALAYDVPKSVVGAVILGFGTSVPELFVGVAAALDGSTEIALGAVVGSNIANVGLILGVGAMLVSLRVERQVVRVDLPLGVLAATFLVAYVGPAGIVSRTTGLLLLGAFAFYLWATLRYIRVYRRTEPAAEDPVEKRPARDVLYCLVGLVGIAVGAKLLLFGAENIARDLGVSEALIGITLVALGTSLPELAAIIAAARRGEADLAVGNIAGSNLFNVLLVLGTTATVTPVTVSPTTATRDFAVMTAFAVLAFPMLNSARRIGKAQGALLLVSYASYMSWLVWTGSPLSN